MIWFRKGVVLLLSLLLLATLLGTAYSTSFNRTLGKPKKVQAYLSDSRIYDHFVAYVADQAAKSEGDDQTGSVSLSDAAVQAAAKSAFPAQLIERSVNTFIDANYAWLEGRVSVPEFKVDLSKQKETFAQKVGRIVQAYTATLPVCTTAQALQEKGVDPLAATCRPKSVKPADVGAQVTQRLSTTGDFLSDPVITARSVNPEGNRENKPYYQRLSHLPDAYQLMGKLPYILGGLSIVLAAGITFIALTRRKGLRRVGIVLVLAGLALVISRFMADSAIDRAQKRIFNDSSIGQIQRSLTDFAHRVVSSMATTDLWFGIGFLVLAVIILGVLLGTRRKAPKKPGAEPEETPPAAAGGLPLLKARKRLMRPFGDSIMPLGARPAGTAPEGPEEPQEAPEKPEEPPEPGAPTPEPAPKPKRKKRPRLIQ